MALKTEKTLNAIKIPLREDILKIFLGFYEVIEKMHKKRESEMYIYNSIY